MSKCTKGKLETIPYTRRDGDNIRWVKDAKGQSICRTFKPRAEANAKKLVYCWNAFEDGGLVDELRTALERISDIEDERYTHGGFDLEVNNISKAALASNPVAKD